MESTYIITTLILLVVHIALAIPARYTTKSFSHFLVSIPLSFIGITLPLLFFILSAGLQPEWKGGTKYGWIDLFFTGKLALTPLVLWASLALYYVEILKIDYRSESWIKHGFFLGTIISFVSMIHGVIFTGIFGGLSKFLLVPFYVTLWYLIRFFQIHKNTNSSFSEYIFSFFYSIPFWIASFFWSKKLYQDLPSNPPSGCFIVTAAQRGHEKLVGPLTIVYRDGHEKIINEQLNTFWLFEDTWRNKSPSSHKCFRFLYNKIGPIIANRINTPYKADFVYLILKPVELVIKLVFILHNRLTRA